jgi:O-antigen/teichoic acid export membrane protein
MSDERSLPASRSKEAAPIPEGLGRRALSGVTWNYVAGSVQSLGQIAYTVTMSRLVSPEAFGLVAMTAVARGMGMLVSRMGIGQAIIQKPRLSPPETRAAFTSAVAFGLLFFGLSWVLAPVLAGVFKEPRAVSVIRGASLAFIALGLNTTAESLMRRDMRFKELSLIHIVGFVVGYFVIGVGSALAGAGLWALVFAPIAHTLINAGLTYSRVRHPIRPTFDPRSYGALLSFGSRETLTQFGDFLGTHTDTIVVARYAGAASLGMYNRAFYLAVLPLQMIMSTMDNVLFVSFSHLQTDVRRLTQAYLTSSTISAALFLPISAGIGAAGHELIVVLLGERYREAAVIVPFFAAYAATSRMSSLCGILCVARGQLNQRLVLQGAYLLALAGGMLAVAGGPLWAYGAVLAGGELVRNLAYNVLIIRKIIPVTLRDLFGVYVPALSATALVIAAVVAVRIVVIHVMRLPVGLALTAEIAAAATTFLALVRWGRLSFIREEIVKRLPHVRAESRTSRLLGLLLSISLGNSPRPRK